MKRRYLLLIFFLLLGLVLWGMVHVVEINTPTLHPSPDPNGLPTAVVLSGAGS